MASTNDWQEKARDKAKRRAHNRRRGPSMGLLVSVVVFVVAIGAAIALSRSGGGAAAATPGATDALKAIGGTNAMGFPYVETPGSASGAASAGGVEVDGANWTMGQVPLDIAVVPAWTLRNTGTTPVSLGKPQAEVRKGCCPGPLVLGADTLAPGESTTLTFELSMHPGMDGWHDMGVTVPVTGADGSAQSLALSVTGDFRN